MGRIDSILATRLKRKSQTCKVFELKVDQSKLSQKSRKHLELLFLEAKWFYNYCLAQPYINKANTTLKSVPVKVKDIYEDRKLNVLMSHMKQSIKRRIFISLKSLSTKKKNGRKVGKLKFKSIISSIPLPQYHQDFDFNFKKSTVRLSGLKQKLRVKGLKQIPENVEIANAHIIKKDKDYFFHITTFATKEEKQVPEASIGIDFGCKTQLTLSNGIKIEYQVQPSFRLKRLDRRISKKVNGKIGKNRQSNNRRKLQFQRRKEYFKLISKKKDIKNKIVNALTKNYKVICFQDENIKAWAASNHGKKIQTTGIGGIISALKHKAHTPILVNKFFSSTQLCPKCGNKRKLNLDERVYNCECGYKEDRDIHAARNILVEGIKRVPMDYRDFKPEKNLSSTLFDTLSKINGIKISKIGSMSQEATEIRMW